MKMKEVETCSQQYKNDGDENVEMEKDGIELLLDNPFTLSIFDSFCDKYHANHPLPSCMARTNVSSPSFSHQSSNSAHVDDIQTCKTYPLVDHAVHIFFIFISFQ